MDERNSNDDLEIMRRISADRDSAALGKLYDRYSPLVYGLSLRTLRNSDDAGDLLQDIFLYVWEKGKRFDPTRASLRSWLCLVTKSKALDALRVRRREFSRESGELQIDIADSDPGPLAHLTNSELLKQLAAALDALPAAQRDVIKLAWDDQLSQQEISDRLKCPLGTVKTRIRLGMISLRDACRGGLA